MENDLYISVVIPAFNEVRNISTGALEMVAAYFEKQSYKCEILVVDDGSTDNSASLVAEITKTHPIIQLIKNPHRGKAFAVKTGVMEAQGQYVLFTDMDQATPPQEIEKLLPFIEKRGYDVVVGSREIMGSKREEEPWYRHIMGKGFNIIVQILAVHNIHDTQCGFKLFRTSIARELFSAMQVYRGEGKEIKGPFVSAFDVELLFLAQKRRNKIAEVPVIWHHVKSERVNPIKDSYKMFIDVLKIRLNDITGVYAKDKE